MEEGAASPNDANPNAEKGDKTAPSLCNLCVTIVSPETTNGNTKLDLGIPNRGAITIIVHPFPDNIDPPNMDSNPADRPS